MLVTGLLIMLFLGTIKMSLPFLEILGPFVIIINRLHKVNLFKSCWLAVSRHGGKLAVWLLCIFPVMWAFSSRGIIQEENPPRMILFYTIQLIWMGIFLPTLFAAWIMSSEKLPAPVPDLKVKKNFPKREFSQRVSPQAVSGGSVAETAKKTKRFLPKRSKIFSIFYWHEIPSRCGGCLRTGLL